MLADLVEESANNPGNGLEVSLLGAMANRRGFVGAFGNGARVYYALSDDTQTEWGVGTVRAASPNRLERTEVLGNTAGTTARLNFTGACRVYNEVPADRFPWLGLGGFLSLKAQEASAYAVVLRGRTDGAAVLAFMSPDGTTERARVQADGAGNLDFGVGPVVGSRLRIAISGGVGVGTVSPTAPFHVQASIPGTAMVVQQTQSAAPGVQVLYNGPVYNVYTRVEQTTGNFEFVDSAYANPMLQITQGGSVYNRTGTYGTISDQTMKENITPARDYTADLMRLGVVRYSLIADALPAPNMIGLIAQQVQEVFPGLVEELPGPIAPELTEWAAAVRAWQDAGGEGSGPAMPDVPPAPPILAVKTMPLLMMLLQSHQELVRRVKTLEDALTQ